ncbi:Kelch repeat-containing protein [Flavobacterium noncentrifugens]|uniref:Por secretion system C-terminal sorting domain-containing protein n=1 Tax=Flavobacterium noncentrifugens TaxID=1128970 RepID=A0A1G8YZU4_9FLAO|nr:T9SS type A sorting domain-containing protein [Flavobacterium noncentrifugens]SDK08409.1 Por secretion system C-terminal sorting domain-containing protein [Flavobacterium noncentrifugens]
MKITLLFFIAGISSAFSQSLTFTSKADMATARSGSSAATNGIYEFIANGFSATNANTAQIEKYQFDTDTWSAFETSVPTVPKRYGNAEIANGKLYLFNGKTGSGNNNQLEIIDTATGNVTYGAANPFPVSGAGSAVYGTDIYFFGGNVADDHALYSNALYKYNTVSNEWTPLAAMSRSIETTGKAVGNRLYVFGGYSESDAYTENFQTVETTGNLVLADWINVVEVGTKFFQGKYFGTNKYAQISAFDSNAINQESLNISWLISPPYSKTATTETTNTFLSFNTKDGYNNGATLQAYIITNWTGNIETSTKFLLPARIASGTTSGYAVNFTSSDAISLEDYPDNFRIAYKYIGGYAPEATTTYQIDNVRIYSSFTSPYISRYDIAANSWSEMDTQLPQPVSANAVATSGTKVFVSGDYYEQSFLGAFDTANSSFTTMTALDYLERRHHAAAVHNNSLYVFGGNKTEFSSTVINSTQAAGLGVLISDEFNAAGALTAYPNPVNDILHFNGDIQNVSVYTVDGKKLQVKQLNSGIEMSELNPGIYMVTGQTNTGKTVAIKVVKK